MTETQIYRIEADGEAILHTEVDRGWSGAPFIWNQLSEKYNMGEGMMTGFRKTWGAVNSGLYTRVEDIVLATTFDRVYVAKKDFPKVIFALGEFIETNPSDNLESQIKVITELSYDNNCIGIGWNQNSNTSSIWDDTEDEDTGDTIYYNIFEQSDHWDLFEDLDGEN